MNAIFENEAGSGTATVNEYIDSGGTDLCVEREDIQFYNVAPDRLRIEVTVHNRGYVASQPKLMLLEAAPLGAFVTWKPLQRLQVPVIAAGESQRVSTEVNLAAEDSPGENRTREDEAVAIRRFNQAISDVAGATQQLISARNLSAMDPSRTANRANKHWAGNINVLLDNKAVERHQAHGLRVHPGIENWALFNLGSRKGEEYIFTFDNTGAEWATKLFHLPNVRDEHMAVHEVQKGFEHLGQGIESGGLIVTSTGFTWMAAMVSPPEDSTEGKLNIDIRELSSGRNAIVEFQMMANAQGRGLYTF